MIRTLPELLVATSILTASCTQSSFPVFCAVPVGDSPVEGSASAWATLVVFSDFECPYCADAATTLDRLAEHYDESELRIAFKHLPLSLHEHSMAAALAAQCAHEQGRFWDMHDTLFSHQDALDDASLATYAADLELDLEAWDLCRTSTAAGDRIEADLELATTVGVPATPTFFINGSPRFGSCPLADLVDAVDAALDDAMASATPREEYYDSLTQLACE